MKNSVVLDQKGGDFNYVMIIKLHEIADVCRFGQL